MKLLEKIKKIVFNLIPVLLMIALIPFIRNDYILTGVYVIIILISFILKYNKKELLFFIFGFIAMIISEYLFISTGVETFVRNSLFGIMPLWLPFLWAYAFVVIRRIIIVLDK